MICPYCGSENKDSSKFCEECGARLPQADTAARERSYETAANLGLSLSAAARQERLTADYSGETIISPRSYNAILVGVLLWGLLVNVLLCSLVGDVYRFLNPILFLVLYAICAFAGIAVSRRSQNPVISFLGYNMIVVPFGLLLSTMVDFYGGIDPVIVKDAFVYTLLMCMGMLGMCLAFPQLFEKLGGALLGCLAGIVLCELVLLLLGVRQNITDWIAAGLFSLYIGYDIYRSQRFTRTVDNAVDCALDIYMDIANLFLRLLRIFASRKKD